MVVCGSHRCHLGLMHHGQGKLVLGFSVRRERGEVSLVRVNDDLSETTMTLPRHSTLKGPTIQSALRQAGISRDEFLDAYNKS